MRFGTPIIVPDGGGPGPLHARATGGATFRDASELLHATATFRERGAPGGGRERPLARYADGHYGDPEALVERLGELLGRDGGSVGRIGHSLRWACAGSPPDRVPNPMRSCDTEMTRSKLNPSTPGADTAPMAVQPVS